MRLPKMPLVDEQTTPWAGLDGTVRRARTRLPDREPPHRTILLLPGLALPRRPTMPGYMPALVDGLCAHGLAVARWEPPWSVAGATPLGERDWHGEIDDAVAALSWLREQPWVEPAQIYLLGLSLGGVAAPRVAQRAGPVAGIAAWGSTARPWSSYAVATLRHQLLWLGRPADQVACAVEANAWWYQQLADTERSAAELLEQKPALAELEVTAEGLMGRPTAFWRQLCRFDAAGAYRGLDCRICSVRGSADFAAQPADHEAIVRAATAAGLRVRAIELEGLDHLLRPAASARDAFAGRVLGPPAGERLADAVASWIEEEPRG